MCCLKSGIQSMACSLARASGARRLRVLPDAQQEKIKDFLKSSLKDIGGIDYLFRLINLSWRIYNE
jgi:hypothetical protein